MVCATNGHFVPVCFAISLRQKLSQLHLQQHRWCKFIRVHSFSNSLHTIKFYIEFVLQF